MIRQWTIRFLPDRVRMFSFKYERLPYPNDGSIETTISLTWLYRSASWAWSRQIRKSECPYHSGDGSVTHHYDECRCEGLYRRWPAEEDE